MWACLTGCMESLVHYKQLLLRNHLTSIGEEGSQVLVKECLELLDQLESIDPQRRRRYQQLGEYRLLLALDFELIVSFNSANDVKR